MEPIWIVFGICLWLMMFGVFIDFVIFVWQAFKKEATPSLSESSRQ